MAQKGDLLSFRPDIKVLDATIRDGGLVNDFYFKDEFIKALYKANVKAGVDYMCCVDITMVSTRSGRLFSSYSTVTWLLESGRR